MVPASFNIFSITRQLRYSKDETQLALDLCLFINGLPIATFELKNRLTKQTVEDAVQQYKRDRDPRELLFQFARCLVHFAVDDQEVRFCTHLKGKESWFLPFNKGYNDGAGNPPNPDGLKTDYLWRESLQSRMACRWYLALAPLTARPFGRSLGLPGPFRSPCSLRRSAPQARRRPRRSARHMER